jgi:hypothetical protein
VDLASRGEPSKLNERKVGDILRSLGLTNRDRTNTGYVLNLERSTRVRIHQMARDYEYRLVPKLRSLQRGCYLPASLPRSTLEAANKNRSGQLKPTVNIVDVVNLGQPMQLEPHTASPNGRVHHDCNRSPGTSNELPNLRSRDRIVTGNSHRIDGCPWSQ